MYCLPKSVCCVCDAGIPMCIYVFPLYVSFVCCMRDVISEFNSEIEGSLAFSLT